MTKEQRVGELQLSPALRTVGASPSDYVDVVRFEVDRTLKEAGGNRLKAFNLGLLRMRASGLITDSDVWGFPRKSGHG